MSGPEGLELELDLELEGLSEPGQQVVVPLEVLVEEADSGGPVEDSAVVGWKTLTQPGYRLLEEASVLHSAPVVAGSVAEQESEELSYLGVHLAVALQILDLVDVVVHLPDPAQVQSVFVS